MANSMPRLICWSGACRGSGLLHAAHWHRHRNPSCVARPPPISTRRCCDWLAAVRVRRLVTTNFDRVFHTAARCSGKAFQAYTLRLELRELLAPQVALKKPFRWDDEDASTDEPTRIKQLVDWLLANGAWWLWSTDTGREVFRLLVLQGRQLAADAQDHLEAAILAGPPREMYRNDLELDRWQDIGSVPAILSILQLKDLCKQYII